MTHSTIKTSATPPVPAFYRKNVVFLMRGEL
jgi:hypothetical protein